MLHIWIQLVGIDDEGRDAIEMVQDLIRTGELQFYFTIVANTAAPDVENPLAGQHLVVDGERIATSRERGTHDLILAFICSSPLASLMTAMLRKCMRTGSVEMAVTLSLHEASGAGESVGRGEGGKPTNAAGLVGLHGAFTLSWELWVYQGVGGALSVDIPEPGTPAH